MSLLVLPSAEVPADVGVVVQRELQEGVQLRAYVCIYIYIYIYIHIERERDREIDIDIDIDVDIYIYI